jgi:hypothetical protein
MIEVLAEQIRAEMIQETHQEIERIYQALSELERCRRVPVNPVILNRKQQPPTTLKGIIKDSMDQAIREEALSERKEKTGLAIMNGSRATKNNQILSAPQTLCLCSYSRKTWFDSRYLRILL